MAIALSELNQEGWVRESVDGLCRSKNGLCGQNVVLGLGLVFFGNIFLLIDVS